MPIAFRLITYEDYQQGRETSQNRIEEQFLRDVVGMLPNPERAMLLFDRGYARVALLQLLGELGVHYAVRIKKNIWVSHRSHTGCLQGFTVDKGVQLWWPGALYHQTARYPLNIAITRNATAEEPWRSAWPPTSPGRRWRCTGTNGASAARSSFGTSAKRSLARDQ